VHAPAENMFGDYAHSSRLVLSQKVEQAYNSVGYSSFDNRGGSLSGGYWKILLMTWHSRYQGSADTRFKGPLRGLCSRQ